MRTYGETDGQAGITKPIVVFRNFSKAHNKSDVTILKVCPFLCVTKQKSVPADATS